MCLPICEYKLFPLTEPLWHARPCMQPPQAPWGIGYRCIIILFPLGHSDFLITFSLIMLDYPRLCWIGRGDHPKTFLLKALCCQNTPSWLKVGGWVVAPGIILSSPGTGGTLYFYSQSQSLDNCNHNRLESLQSREFYHAEVTNIARPVVAHLQQTCLV